VKKATTSLELQEKGHWGVFIGERYNMMLRDSTVNSIPNLHLESAMYVRILLGFRKGIRPFLIRFLNLTRQRPMCP
jgi:hypothetical protein